MELVLKIPKDKPPFIGILYQIPFASNYKAADFFRKPNDIYQIEMEPSKELILWLKIANTSVRYSIDYDPVTLLKFIYRTRNEKMFNFGCLYQDGKGFKVCQAENRKMILKVDKVSIADDPLLSLRMV